MVEPRVLVTGGNGFIARACLRQLKAEGYRLRATVRQPLLSPLEGIEVVGADLNSDSGWNEATRGCDLVLHVASPFPVGAPRRDSDLVNPAREGTLRVLRAAKASGVVRVVLTSSFAAIGYGTTTEGVTYDETHWTKLHPRLSAYVKSKTLAEQAAWEFSATAGASELTVVNPVAVFGPVEGPQYSSSIEILASLLRGSLPALPRLCFGVVDVRDVADLHVRAMRHPAAAGQRFLASAGDFVTLEQVARLLRSALGPRASRVTTVIAPDWLVRLAAQFNASAAQTVSELGKTKRASSEKARSLLGWNPRSSEEALLATADSLLRLGLIR